MPPKRLALLFIVLAAPIACLAQHPVVSTIPACESNASQMQFTPRRTAKTTAQFVGSKTMPNSLERAVWTMDRELAGRVLSDGADPNAVSSGNKLPLIVIAAMQGDPLVIAMLLARGANIEAAADRGTPLYWAARQGNLGAVRTLLSCGANVHFKAPDGATPLHMTMGDDNDVEVAAALIDGGADLEAQHAGMTPLMEAALFGRAAWVELLIKRGANLHAKTSDGASVLAFAKALVNSPEVIEMLVRAGAK